MALADLFFNRKDAQRLHACLPNRQAKTAEK